MPREIRTDEEFRKILEKASECRVIRHSESVKIKLRTPKILYTFVTKPEQADKLLKDIKIKLVEY